MGQPTTLGVEAHLAEQTKNKGLWWWFTPTGENEAPPILYVLFAFIAAAVVVGIYLSDDDVPQANKVRMVASVVVGLVAFAVAVVLYARSRSSRVATAVDAVALLAGVGAVAVAPVLLFARPDQLLLFKLTVIVLLALLPGLVYFQFLASRGEALWDEFIETLRRLDVDDFGPVPKRGELPQDNDVYYRKFEGTYGRIRSARDARSMVRRTSGSARSRTVLPVFLLTAIVALGWVATLEPEAVGSGRLFGDLTVTGEPGLSVTALRFSFVGSYFFVLQMIVRRYFQNDLKADAYLSGVMRLVTSALVAATAAVVLPGLTEAQLTALAFMLGVFPQFGVDVIRTGLVYPLQAWLKGHQSNYPLSDLDGMNIWYEARLLEEGVEDMQNLKTASWVQLLLNTRIPPGRLVDWVDQSHLLLHVLPPQQGRRARNGERTRDRDQLRRFGVRTATDLEAAVYSSRADHEHRPNIGLEADRAVAILRTLAAEPVLHNVRAWKEQDDPSAMAEGVGMASVVRGASRAAA